MTRGKSRIKLAFMMPCLNRLCALAVLAALLVAPAVAGCAEKAGGVHFGISTIDLVTAKGSYTFRVEIARSNEQRMQGLMFRRSLAPGAGMLFDFGQAQAVSMWMKNTLVALDMLFLAADGRILNIAENTTPGSLTPITSAGPAKGVLEVPAGTARRLGLHPGDRVLHRLFGG